LVERALSLSFAMDWFVSN